LSVTFIRLVFHFFADVMQMVAAVEPIGVTIANEAEYRLGSTRFHSDDDQTRQQILFDRK